MWYSIWLVEDGWYWLILLVSLFDTIFWHNHHLMNSIFVFILSWLNSMKWEILYEPISSNLIGLIDQLFPLSIHHSNQQLTISCLNIMFQSYWFLLISLYLDSIWSLLYTFYMDYNWSSYLNVDSFLTSHYQIDPEYHNRIVILNGLNNKYCIF